MHDTRRLLIIEDDIARVYTFQSWCPPDVRLIWAKSAGVALGMLQRDRGTVYDGILLDHDLLNSAVTSMDKYLCGQDVAGAIAANISPRVPILIHSMNHEQAPRMHFRLQEAGFQVTRIPMILMNQERFTDWLQDCGRSVDAADDIQHT